MFGTGEKLLTAEEFWEQYGLRDERYELVRGEIVEMPPPVFEHGSIQLTLGSRLLGYAEEQDLGRVLVEVDFRLSEDTVRRPDVAFIAKARLPLITDPYKFVSISPDLAVEIISASETAQAMQEKVREYFEFGVRLVWVVYPRRKEVVVHQPDGSAQTYTLNDSIDGGEVLPGLVLTLARLFP